MLWKNKWRNRNHANSWQKYCMRGSLVKRIFNCNFPNIWGTSNYDDAKGNISSSYLVSVGSILRYAEVYYDISS